MTSILRDAKGRRKFLEQDERQAFVDACHDASAQQRTLCLLLAHSGCQIAEALSVTISDIDLPGHAVYLDDGPGRRRGVPLPPDVIQAIDTIHAVERLQRRGDESGGAHLWPVDRTTASRWVHSVMRAAGLSGPKASPRGLRHGFAVQAIRDGVSPEVLQRWMGHVEISSTMAYFQALEAEDEIRS